MKHANCGGEERNGRCAKCKMRMVAPKITTYSACQGEIKLNGSCNQCGYFATPKHAGNRCNNQRKIANVQSQAANHLRIECGPCRSNGKLSTAGHYQITTGSIDLLVYLCQHCAGLAQNARPVEYEWYASTHKEGCALAAGDLDAICECFNEAAT